MKLIIWIKQASVNFERVKSEITSGNFQNVVSAQVLEKLGMDFLRDELNKRGMKCGGTIKERAERLYLLKHTAIENLDRKHFPKQTRN